jgi:hypothetical protein
MQFVLQAGSAGQSLQLSQMLPVPMRTSPSATVIAGGSNANVSVINLYTGVNNIVQEVLSVASGTTFVTNRVYLLSAEI